jgi:hypothetical protein
MNTFRLRLVLLTAIVLVLSACGAAGGGGSDPAGAVKAAFDATQSGGLAKLDDFACAAQKGKLAEAFGGAAGADQFQSAGVNMNDVMNAMTVKFDNVTTKETNRTDTNANVHVTGNMTITVDQEKFKPILKAMLAAQNLPNDDATITTALNAMAGSLSKSQPLDQDVKVVNEGGKWLICA